MPTILIKNGFRFFFYSNEGNEPPHIHVIGKGGEAKIWLNPIEITYVYNFGFVERRQILIITQENVNLFMNEWRKWHGKNDSKK